MGWFCYSTIRARRDANEDNIVGYSRHIARTRLEYVCVCIARVGYAIRGAWRTSAVCYTIIMHSTMQMLYVLFIIIMQCVAPGEKYIFNRDEHESEASMHAAVVVVLLKCSRATMCSSRKSNVVSGKLISGLLTF